MIFPSDTRFSMQVLIMLALLLSGCQGGSPVVSPGDRYFTWVDEQGRMRYSPMIGSGDQGKGATGNPEQETGAATAAESEFTLENYPDADQLAADGYVRPGTRQPYYTWRDAQGNIRVSYYQPDTGTDKHRGRPPTAPEITPARVYRAGVADFPDPSVRGDPDVLAVLGIDADAGDSLAWFSGACCQTLDSRDHERWQMGREFAVHITKDSPRHRFATGPSHFRIVSLSAIANRPDFIMVLRSYNHKGVFVPSLAFLDRNLEPVRLVTDLLGVYEPGNWHRRGYLQARVPVFPGQGERWLVIFTRDRDLDGQTVVETDQGTLVVPHVATGELGLNMAGEE